MVTLLLAIIYLAFISLGLPDSLLGSAWPQMHTDLQAPISSAGLVTMLIAGGTVISSLFSDKLNHKFGAGPVTAFSTLLTAVALFGFSVSDSLLMICLFSVPYGLGAGAIDAALNNYVALHYNSRQMSWLHCFWGMGAAVSPYIMGYALGKDLGWRSGYGIVFCIQLIFTLVLFLTLPVWKKAHGKGAEEAAKTEEVPFFKAVKIKGVAFVLIAFFAYCAFESTCGLWASSYLVEHKNIDVETAASFASLFYLGITAGRFLTGFIADKFGDRRMIRLGLSVVLGSIVLMLLPVSGTWAALVGLVIAGLGAAPVYPAVIHATPDNFGKENSQAIIGIQMASAYIGTTFMPPVFGLMAQHISIGLYPYFLAVFTLLALFMTERLNHENKKKASVRI